MTLEIAHLDFAYERSRTVLTDVGAAIHPGSFFAVVGPNGAGKSTLLRLAAGLLRPTRGHVHLDTRPIHRLSARDRASRLAYIAQRPDVAGAFAARDVVALGRFALGRDDHAVHRAIERIRLTDRADDAFHHLSAGQQQRIALARALAQVDPNPSAETRARCIIADEPISALDPVHARLALDLLRNFTSRGGSILASLHDLTAAARYADHALVLGPGGDVVSAGPASESLAPHHLERAFGARFASGEIEGARIITPI